MNIYLYLDAMSSVPFFFQNIKGKNKQNRKQNKNINAVGQRKNFIENLSC